MTKFLFLLLLFSFGCSKYYVSVRREKIDASYLASSYVNTPDPRQKNPPFGQQLIIDWLVPERLIKQEPQVVLYIIFKNYTEHKETFSIDAKRGYAIYSLLDKNYMEKKGILTYRAEIVTREGVYRDWKHQLWVNLIHVD